MNSGLSKVANMQRSLEFCSHHSFFQKQPGLGVQISSRTFGYIMTTELTQILFPQIFSTWLLDGKFFMPVASHGHKDKTNLFLRSTYSIPEIFRSCKPSCLVLVLLTTLY